MSRKAYNNDNQRTSHSPLSAATTFNYTYDNIGQLKTAIGSRLQDQLGYAYDAVGNLKIDDPSKN